MLSKIILTLVVVALAFEYTQGSCNVKIDGNVYAQTSIIGPIFSRAGNRDIRIDDDNTLCNIRVLFTSVPSINIRAQFTGSSTFAEAGNGGVKTATTTVGASSSTFTFTKDFGNTGLYSAVVTIAAAGPELRFTVTNNVVTNVRFAEA